MWEMKGFTKGARGAGSSFTAHDLYHCAQLILYLLLSFCFIIHCLDNMNVMTHHLLCTKYVCRTQGGDALM